MKVKTELRAGVVVVENSRVTVHTFIAVNSSSVSHSGVRVTQVSKEVVKESHSGAAALRAISVALAAIQRLIP